MNDLEDIVDESFTPKQVAIALRVSESSVKRWCDRGLIRTDRTMGGHRRIPLNHLMEFLESTNRRLTDPGAIGLPALSFPEGNLASADDLDQLGSKAARDRLGSRLGNESYSEEGASFRESLASSSGGGEVASRDFTRMREEFERALVAGNESEARRLLSVWYALRGGMVSVADDLIAPAFQSVGELWECGDVDIYQERRGCEICMRLILEIRRLQPEPFGSAPLAMGGTTSGDPYQLPSQLIDMVLRECGWRSVNLGCDLPFPSLLSAARTHLPKIFWLSVSYVRDESQFVEECDRFASQLPKGIVFVIGGAALHEGLRKRLRYSSYNDNMQQLASLAKSIRAAIQPAGIRI